ncbi:hypothetical protein SAMN05444161_5563 [Rhizobiales bacterium GAS191]|nr:hypothetical protein SAMN05444161_5563 [Rhizobiales bacterium GAS191]
MPHITWDNLHEAVQVIGTRVTVDRGALGVMGELAARGYIDVGEESGKRVFRCNIPGFVLSTLQALSRAH